MNSPFNQEKTFIIDRTASYETKSKDALTVVIDRAKTASHFSLAWSPHTAVYTVTNRSKAVPAVYTVAFFLSQSQLLILGSCDCVAHVICKHLAGAWKVHKQAENAGFIPTIQTKEEN